MDTSGSRDSSDFLTLITQYQSAIRGYIRGSVVDYHDANDVMQKTNAVMCKKEGSWNREIPFLKWAFSIAKYEVLAFYRDRAREKVVFNDEVLELVLQDCEKLVEKVTDRSLAMSHCMTKLADEEKVVLSYKYISRLSSEQIGEEIGRTSNGVRSLLKRLRAGLRECIQFQMKEVK